MLEVDVAPPDDGAGPADEGPSLNDMASMRAAKQLCGLLGVDPGKAAALDKALRAHYEACSA